jgi:oxygen-independent coproporphyrinogen-3 oxidase
MACKGNYSCKYQIEADFPPAALYVHVPFCQAKCRYCDFYSLDHRKELQEPYVTAAISELHRKQSLLRLPLESIFFGGGTPTALAPHLLKKLLDSVTPLLGEQTEFSVEINPGTLTGNLPSLLVASGVNRINLGVQSFNDEELLLLGRIHTARQANEAIREIRRSGIENIGLDLIYALPNQTLGGWKNSLYQALELDTKHLSCYALSFEQGTPLARDLAKGKIHEMPEELQRDCYYTAIDLLTNAGYCHYETSNFARPGYSCRHNCTYWQNRPYLGIGPAAASYIGGIRYTNRPDLSGYIDALSSGGDVPQDSEQLIGREHMAETLMLGLRLIEGIGRTAFSERFGIDPLEAFPQTMKRYQSLEMLEITSERVRLTRQAFFVADSILADLLAEA